VPKCVICDADSIFRGHIFYQNFSHYKVSVGLKENFPLSAREHYDRACLNPNHSKKGRPTPLNFTDVVQSYVLYKALASVARSVAPFLSEVPVKTRHFREMTIFLQRPFLKLNYSELWRFIPVLFSLVVQNYSPYKNIV